MPVYSYACACGATEDHYTTVDKRNDPRVCPVDGGEMIRDFLAEQTPRRFAETGEGVSEAMGVNPDQIAEAKKLFPHHNFRPDGAMVFKNYQERKRVIKDLGYRDYDSYS